MNLALTLHNFAFIFFYGWGGVRGGEGRSGGTCGGGGGSLGEYVCVCVCGGGEGRGYEGVVVGGYEGGGVTRGLWGVGGGGGGGALGGVYGGYVGVRVGSTCGEGWGGGVGVFFCDVFKKSETGCVQEKLKRVEKTEK